MLLNSLESRVADVGESRKTGGSAGSRWVGGSRVIDWN